MVKNDVNLTKNESLELSSTIFKLTDRDYFSGLIQSENDVIEISNNVDFNSIDEENLRKLNEIYGKAKKSILMSFESYDDEFSLLLLWKSKKIDQLLLLKITVDNDPIIATELFDLLRKFIRKSLEEDHLSKLN